MQNGSDKNAGGVFGIRYADLFFVPKLRLEETGVQICRTHEFIAWDRIKNIRRVDGPLARFLRGPLGSYVWFDDDRYFWISARLMMKGRSLRDSVESWFKDHTKDYLFVLGEIERRAQFAQEKKRTGIASSPVQSSLSAGVRPAGENPAAAQRAEKYNWPVGP